MQFRQVMIERTLITLWFLVIIGVGMWLMAGSVAYWVRVGWLPPDTAGWVQAVGSIMAIIVAVAVPAWQKSHELADRKRKESSARLDAAHAVLGLIQRQLAIVEAAADSISKEAPKPNVYGVRSHRYVEALRSLASHAREMGEIPVLSFGNEFVDDVLRIKARSAFCAEIERAGNKALLMDDLQHFVEDVNRLKHFPYVIRNDEDRLVMLIESIRQSI